MKKTLCSKCKKNPAVIFISRIEGDKTIPEGLCIKCAMDMNLGPVKQMMDSMGVTEDDVDAISEQFNSLMGYGEDDEEDFEAGGTPTMPSLQGLFNALEMEDQNFGDNDFLTAEEPTEEKEKSVKSNTKKDKKKNKGKNKRKYLNLYCTDLTGKAREGKIDIIIGREKEIYRVTQILCRRSKNNPCLIGEPGVGKTAIAEGLALKIANNDVPAKLANKEIHLLDLTALIAGTQFRGQFESRIKGLVDEVKAEGNIILFIDEVHNLVGTGDAEGSMNAANILKPALSRGEIQVIGATTFNEYRKNIEKDAALERRFQPVKVEEPSIEDSYKMLMGIKAYYENYHRVSITDSLVHRAVVLSERYINDRFLPDKAIDLLDEACTCANLRNKAISEHEISERQLKEDKEYLEELMSETKEIDYEEIARMKAELITLDQKVSDLKEQIKDNIVTENDLARVIELWTGIPASKIIESDLRKLSNLEENLNKKLMGQADAVKLVSAAVRRSRVQINPRRKPASFIFVGPTGVGKTELVKQLSYELFDTPETLIRLDMSEFMEKHSVSRIIGSPPGYVGYDEAGQLTEKVRRKPYSVILFDEIEKAHPDVMNILLQILDEGKITDSHGRMVSFENTVIIMTSNAGSERKDGTMGFAKSGQNASKEKAMKALRDFLRPEFIGRVDEIVVFNELTDK
ncbi:MAG: ATP-dependent Clp protease ATP-binding subunit, partial [Oscillospiraceae bacterium]